MLNWAKLNTFQIRAGSRSLDRRALNVIPEQTIEQGQEEGNAVITVAQNCRLTRIKQIQTQEKRQ